MTDTQIADIDQQIASLEAKRKSLLAESRQEALTTTRASVARYGFTASELGLGAATPKATNEKAQKPKAPAKYANPANTSQTWAGGKGARPLWVQSHLAAGKSIDDMLIK
jgi:DNA-binding protein H-NS